MACRYVHSRRGGRIDDIVHSASGRKELLGVDNTWLECRRIFTRSSRSFSNSPAIADSAPHNSVVSLWKSQLRNLLIPCGFIYAGIREVLAAPTSLEFSKRQNPKLCICDDPGR